MGRFNRRVRSLALGLLGTAFGLPLLGGGNCQETARFFNPCFGAGDVFTSQVCTEADFLDLFDGFAPNFDRDPFCSLPQTCPGSGTFDPSAGDGMTGTIGGVAGP